MAKLGPDQREGYISLNVLDGYDQWAPIYESGPNPLIAIEEKTTIGLMKDIGGKIVLDLGCGTGRYCALLAGQGATVIGVDQSPKMLDSAKAKISPVCQFEVRQGTIDKMNFSDGFFDLVISALTFSHMPDIGPTLRQVGRVLKKKGEVIISDIHPFWAVSGHDYAEFFDGKGQEYRVPQYPHLIEEYWGLFKRNNMRIADIFEPKIDDSLIAQFPDLKEYKDIPLAVIIKAETF